MKQFIEAVLGAQQTMGRFYLDRQFRKDSLNSKQRMLLRKVVLVLEELECDLQQDHKYRQCDFCEDVMSDEFANMSDYETCRVCEQNSKDMREHEAAHMDYGKL